MQDNLHKAFMEQCFPCNPLPFSIGLTNLVKEKGSDSIKSDKAKAILWILMAQAYGQGTIIDMFEEWHRLEKIFNAN